MPDVPLPFPPSPIEEAVMAEIARLHAAGADRAAVAARLAELFVELTCFQSDEIELLEAAGLLVLAPAPGLGA